MSALDDLFNRYKTGYLLVKPHKVRKNGEVYFLVHRIRSRHFGIHIFKVLSKSILRKKL